MAISYLIDKGVSVRKTQSEFIKAVGESVEHPGKVSFIHADTGIGKTMGFLSSALDWINDGYRVVVATQSHRLVRQIAHTELKLLDEELNPGLYYGLTRYPSKERIELLMMQETFIADTENYLNALKGFDGAIDDFQEEFGPLPEEVSETSICCIYGDDNEDVKALRESALNSKLVITTHAAVITDALYRLDVFCRHEKTVFIIDEADAFIDSVNASRYQKMSIRDLMGYLVEHCPLKKLTEVTDVTAKLQEVCSGAAVVDVTASRELIRELFKTVKSVTSGDKPWQVEFKRLYPEWLRYHQDVSLSFSPVKKYPQIVISQSFANKNVGDYLCNAHHSVLTSGTLSIKDDIAGMNWAIATLRLTGRTGVVAQFSPENFGKITFTLAAATKDFPKVYVGNGMLSKRWLQSVAKTIKGKKDKSLVVLTGSHDESTQLEEALIEMGDLRLIHRHKSGETIRIAADDFMVKGGIMITAAGHTGLNLVQADEKLAFKSLLITRIGMAPLDEEKALFEVSTSSAVVPGANNLMLMSKIAQREYGYSVVRAVRRIKQAIGRAIRSEHHEAHITICDPRFPTFFERATKFSVLRNAIPLRFHDAYKEASASVERKEEEVFF